MIRSHTVETHNKPPSGAACCVFIFLPRSRQLEKLHRIPAVDLPADFLREIEGRQEFELRDLLVWHQDVRTKEKLVGVADDELPAELGVAGDSFLAPRFGQVAVE